MNHFAPRTTPVLGVDIASVNMSSALRLLENAHKKNARGYVCFVSVHGVMESRSMPELALSYREALCCMPDGAPVAWVGRSQGEAAMGRVGGPDFMLALFADPAFREARHFFYGGDTGVAEQLRDEMQRRFPGVSIVGTYTPPFREMSEPEHAEVAAIIRACKPDFLWIGLGCPKQEVFMRKIASQWDAGITLGVGAAFDFHTGRLQDSPAWVKRAGLQWLHRLVQEPRRLWKRYLITNCAFLWSLFTESEAKSSASTADTRPRTESANGPLAVSTAAATNKSS